MKSKSISVADLVELAETAREQARQEVQAFEHLGGTMAGVEFGKARVARNFVCVLVGTVEARIGEEEARSLAIALGFDHLVS